MAEAEGRVVAEGGGGQGAGAQGAGGARGGQTQAPAPSPPALAAPSKRSPAAAAAPAPAAARGAPPAGPSPAALKKTSTASVAGASSMGKERKKGVPWTEEEHRLFLAGLEKLGKGDWRGISRHFVQSRTPTQVASHAQKYFIRQTNTSSKRKRRQSLFDMAADPSKIPPKPVMKMEKKAKAEKAAAAEKKAKTAAKKVSGTKASKGASADKKGVQVSASSKPEGAAPSSLLQAVSPSPAMDYAKVYEQLSYQAISQGGMGASPEMAYVPMQMAAMAQRAQQQQQQQQGAAPAMPMDPMQLQFMYAMWQYGMAMGMGGAWSTGAASAMAASGTPPATGGNTSNCSSSSAFLVRPTAAKAPAVARPQEDVPFAKSPAATTEGAAAAAAAATAAGFSLPMRSQGSREESPTYLTQFFPVPGQAALVAHGKGTPSQVNCPSDDPSTATMQQMKR